MKIVRPAQLKTKIFLDSGDPEETKEILALLGFLDGQTTNPTLIAKNPVVQARLKRGEKFSKEEIYNFYRTTVQQISELLPQGSVSVEVYADFSTRPEEMLKEGKEMFTWIPNAHIKFPTIASGLTAAAQAIKEGMRINMTLCFTQEQAAAVYAATKGAAPGSVFVSPFVGRLDDRGDNGMDLIANIIKMYKGGHVQVLTASVRNLDHLLYALALGSDIITASYKVLKEWAAEGLPLPDPDYVYPKDNLKPIPYKDIDLGHSWTEYTFTDKLIDKGVEKFASDWNELMAPI